MTLEIIYSKLTEIRRQKEQALANYHALNGAEQVLEQLIEESKAREAQEGEITDAGNV